MVDVAGQTKVSSRRLPLLPDPSERVRPLKPESPSTRALTRLGDGSLLWTVGLVGMSSFCL